MVGTVNPDASRIWDEAEVYVLAKGAVANAAALVALIPGSTVAAIDPKWEFVGLIDASAGIPVNPELEIVHYDGFGHTRYRSKARKGTLSTGFTALEDNSVTRKFVLPGSTSGKIGAPRGVYFYTLYVLRDEDIITDIWVSLRPALLSLGSYTKAEGEQEMYEITVDHANDANQDVFQRVEGSGIAARTVTFTGGPFTAGTFTLSVGGQATSALAYNASATAIDTALEALSTVGAGNATVTGTVAGGLTITVPGTLTANAATLTPTGAAVIS